MPQQELVLLLQSALQRARVLAQPQVSELPLELGRLQQRARAHLPVLVLQRALAAPHSLLLALRQEPAQQAVLVHQRRLRSAHLPDLARPARLEPALMLRSVRLPALVRLLALESGFHPVNQLAPRLALARRLVLVRQPQQRLAHLPVLVRLPDPARQPQRVSALRLV